MQGEQSTTHAQRNATEYPGMVKPLLFSDLKGTAKLLSGHTLLVLLPASPPPERTC